MTMVEGNGVVIKRPVEDVWNYVVDPSIMQDWEDSGATWKQMSEGPIQFGTPIHSSVTKFGRTVTFDLRVTGFEPNRVFSVEAMAGRTRGTRITYLLAPAQDGTTILRRTTDAQFHGILKVLQPFVGFITKRTGQLEARNLKRILEDRDEALQLA